MKVTMYTTPHCPQCKLTKRDFDTLGIDHEVVDLSKDEESRSRLRDEGFRTAPVVVAGEQSWSGYVPDKIRELARIISRERSDGGSS